MESISPPPSTGTEAGGSAWGTYCSFRQVWTVVSKQTGAPSGKQAVGDTSQGSGHSGPFGLPGGAEGKSSQRPRVHRGEGPSLGFTCGLACCPTSQDTGERKGPERTDCPFGPVTQAFVCGASTLLKTHGMRWARRRS